MLKFGQKVQIKEGFYSGLEGKTIEEGLYMTKRDPISGEMDSTMKYKVMVITDETVVYPIIVESNLIIL